MKIETPAVRPSGKAFGFLSSAPLGHARERMGTAGWRGAHKVSRCVNFLEEPPHTPTHRVAKFKHRGDKTFVARAVDRGE